MKNQLNMIDDAPSWASSMCQNWRERAKIPDSITDRQIFKIIEENHLAGQDGAEETIWEIAFLRQELDLPELPEHTETLDASDADGALTADALEKVANVSAISSRIEHRLAHHRLSLSVDDEQLLRDTLLLLKSINLSQKEES